MVCTANDLLEWKDFPKGLRVLLLDEDRDSASKIKSKLQEMQYIVSAFFSEDEALSAISRKKENFHIAIVEVSIHKSDGRYKLLEAMKDLPTIMTSNEQCLNTMMKCIALGAVEFLIKPLSEDKLRNIWQHVVHKAFNATSKSLKSVKEFVGSVLEIQEKNIPTQNQLSEEPKNNPENDQNAHDQATRCDKFPAPSTPQLNQDQDQSNGSPVTKSVDTTNCNSSVTEMEVDLLHPQPECPIKATVDLLPESYDEVNDSSFATRNENTKKKSVHKNIRGAKGSRKKVKVDWTSDLHKKFVQAVEQLGVDQAIPSRILELMKVEGLTRHNIASHLQKYRMSRRHILPKTEERRWPHPRTSTHRNYYPYRPVMAYPTYPTTANHTLLTRRPMWGQHNGQTHGFPMWGPPGGGYPWQPAMEAWHWKPYHENPIRADAWACPVLPPPPFPSSTFSKGDEEIDKIVKEAISKPWLPLPIGLKPPSTDSVLAELSMQGISTVPLPPLQINGNRLR